LINIGDIDIGMQLRSEALFSMECGNSSSYNISDSELIGYLVGHQGSGHHVYEWRSGQGNNSSLTLTRQQQQQQWQERSEDWHQSRSTPYPPPRSSLTHRRKLSFSPATAARDSHDVRDGNYGGCKELAAAAAAAAAVAVEYWEPGEIMDDAQSNTSSTASSEFYRQEQRDTQGQVSFIDNVLVKQNFISIF